MNCSQLGVLFYFKNSAVNRTINFRERLTLYKCVFCLSSRGLLTCSAILCCIPLLSACLLLNSVLRDPKGANSIISAQGFTHAPTILMILG